MVNREQALQIINQEKLNGYNWFDEHDTKPDEIVISENNGKWLVFTTDERAKSISRKEFENINDALENFIKRLRAQKKFNDLYR
ncbi:hypothetical protein J7E34_12560 [Chryseobacterium sp. ISL-80]|nr:Imm59 family immunity protein [Bacillus sp. ISL-35]MBT2704130.1 hypothetical protein [Chryseobacterium sp. ISL-80]